MKKIALLSTIIILSSCSYIFNKKNNEEIQYYNFNERSKLRVNGDEIYITRVTKIDSLNDHIAEIKAKYGNSARLIASWDFSQRPTEELKGEINKKAVYFGANNIVMFEKKDCYSFDIKRNSVEDKPGLNCYHIRYYQFPAVNEQAKSVKEVKPAKAEEALNESSNNLEVKK